MSTLNLINIDGVALTEDFLSLKRELESLETRNEDVWVTAFPKSGCTWTQEMVWLLKNNLDYEKAQVMLQRRYSFIDFGAFRNETTKFIEKHKIPTDFSVTSPDYLKIISESEGGRFIKSHLPFDFLPTQIKNGTKTPKIIHVIRNPKQVVPSYFHHATKVFPFFVGSLNEFVDCFINEQILYGDYFRTVLSYWNEKHRSNLLIITYEEMHSNLLGVIKKVSKFLDKTYTEEEYETLSKHLSFDQMKLNVAVNMEAIIKNKECPFIRKGSIDSYKEELSPEMISKLDQWINLKIKNTGLFYEN
nr:amine sulfotransferase-like [Onthophagus taurus]